MGALGPRRGANQRGFPHGFTLVELLVVLVLLGLLAGLIVPQLEPDPRRALQREATRLAGALEHVVTAAQWRGETLGASFERSAYRFWRRDADGTWHVLTDDDVLAARALPSGMEVLADRYAGAPVAPDAIVPFRPTGRNEPYRIRLLAGPWVALVDADPLNRLGWTVQRADGAGP